MIRYSCAAHRRLKGKNMIRFIVIVLYLLLYLILSIPVLFVEWIIGKCNPALRTKAPRPL